MTLDDLENLDLVAMADQEEDTETSGMKSYFCVEYPGKVNNVDRMLETLGGQNTINEVFSTPNRRLELRFRPDDPYCKPACGDRQSIASSSLLLKVKLMKNKNTGETKVVPEVMGPVAATYKFNSMCDFQFLPMVREGDEHKSILDKVVIDQLVTTDSMKDSKDTPLFIPPAAFSRMDYPQDYHFRKEVGGKGLETPGHIIGRTRQRRSLYGIFVTYDAERIPDKANESALHQLKLKMIDKTSVEKVKKLFEKQPVWLKNALAYETGYQHDRLKYILPVVAYYFSSGPWRNQWIRLGYDPRREPDASRFQTLDYRVRLGGGARKLIKAKRQANQMKVYKTANASKAKVSVIDFNSPSTRFVFF